MPTAWADASKRPGPADQRRPEQFRFLLLTERECRVAQYLLRGHSTRSLSERLGISEDTVKTHRKNLYTKLDIAKQSELFSLFIDSLAQAQEGLSKDPLESYLRRR